MGIGHIFEVDDYSQTIITQIVFFKSMSDKSKEKNDIVSYYFFFICCGGTIEMHV